MSIELKDSVFELLNKYSKTHYVQTSKVYPFAKQAADRCALHPEGEGIVTFIAKNPQSLLAIIPDYKDACILKMYAYSEDMVACDVYYTLSKKQMHALRKGNINGNAYKTPDISFDIVSQNEIEDLEACRAGGFVFAQTYRINKNDGHAVAMTPPLGLDWKVNSTPNSDGLFQVGNDREVQTWRAVFTHIHKQPQIRDSHKFGFALELARDLVSNFKFFNELHSAQLCPGWEYKIKLDVDGESVVPVGYYWEENVVYGYDHHLDRGEQKYTVWRRPRERAIADVENVWLPPSKSVSLLNPKSFGANYGTFLPSKMAGIDFPDGPIAGIGWFGKLTYQVRSFEGDVSEEREWTADTHLPLNKDDLLGAIREFAKEHPEPAVQAE